MSAKQFSLATLAGGITLFILGYLFYVVVLAGFFAAHAGTATGAVREPPIIWGIFVAELALAALMTIIYGRWATISTAVGGLKAGAVIGLLYALNFGLVMFATTNTTDLTAVAVDLVVSAVRLGIAGAVIGLILGKVAP
jgi:hypothetical protein